MHAILRKALAAGALTLVGAAPAVGVQEAGAPGGPGLAILTQKALLVPLEGQQVQDHAVILVRDGLIEAVAHRDDLVVPSGYEVRDVGADWVCPGFVDLHSHIAGTRGLNDTVYQTNPGLRISATVIPKNPALELGVAGGVSTILFIPGSGSNLGVRACS